MIVTAELSLYPLTTDYEPTIIAFIKKLKSYPHIEVNTHAMSTFVRGESDQVFESINAALLAVNDKTETVSLVIKMINRQLPVDKGFLNF